MKTQDTLPPIGTTGNYIMPAIISNGVQLAPEVKYPVKVIGHIGAFRVRLQELRCERLWIETHFTAFEAAN